MDFVAVGGSEVVESERFGDEGCADAWSACGALRSADGGQLRLAVTGNHDPITVPLAQITNLTVVPTCE